MIVELDGVTFNQARESGTLSTLAKACEENMIWGVKVSDMNLVQENPLKKICTGIRPPWHPERHDQICIATVRDALRTEPEFIVVGRPITTAGNMIDGCDRAVVLRDSVTDIPAIIGMSTFRDALTL
jgi:orotidine-5'-phosphate decarboxylase